MWIDVSVYSTSVRCEFRIQNYVNQILDTNYFLRADTTLFNHAFGEQVVDIVVRQWDLIWIFALEVKPFHIWIPQVLRHHPALKRFLLRCEYSYQVPLSDTSKAFHQFRLVCRLKWLRCEKHFARIDTTFDAYHGFNWSFPNTVRTYDVAHVCEWSTSSTLDVLHTSHRWGFRWVCR